MIDGPGREKQLGGDLGVAVPGADQPEHLALAPGQPERIGPGRAPRPGGNRADAKPAHRVPGELGGGRSAQAGDIHDRAPGGPFDAITGRLVLMYVPDPAAVVRTQAGVLRPGGVVAPIEFDLHSARSLPSTPLVGQALSWLGETFIRAGVDPALGPRLWAVLQAAGLHPAGMIGVQPHFGPQDPDGPAILAGIIRTVLPLIERLGVATAAAVGADTLQQRLSGELVASAAVFAHPMLISAWGTTGQAK
jgi:SAM-dependent methyltransferase